MALALHVAIAQAQEKLVALSFDDGPNTTTTVHMLDVLKKHQVKIRSVNNFKLNIEL